MSATGTCIMVIQPRQFKVPSQKRLALDSPNYPNSPAGSAAQSPVSGSFQGQHLPLELLTCHNIQHWIQTATYTTDGLKEVKRGIKDARVRWRGVLILHEHDGHDHDVVGHERNHKDEYGGGYESQWLPSSVPSTPR